MKLKKTDNGLNMENTFKHTERIKRNNLEPNPKPKSNINRLQSIKKQKIIAGHEVYLGLQPDGWVEDLADLVVV